MEGEGMKSTKREKTKRKNIHLLKWIFQSILGKVSCLLIVALCLTVTLGVVSYKKASKALSDSYIASTSSTLKAISTYFDLGITNAKNQIVQLYNDETLNKYHNDEYYDDELKANNAALNIRIDYTKIAAVNNMCLDIYSISEKSKLITSTMIKDTPGLYDKVKEEFEKRSSTRGWFSNHDYLDEITGRTDEDYAVSYGMHMATAEGYLMVDIQSQEMIEYLNGFSIGDEGILSIVVSDQKEYYALNTEKPNPVVGETTFGAGLISGQDFFQEAKQGEESQGYKYVTFKGDPYLFLYSKIGDSGLIVTGLIPKSVVVGQANSIKNSTIAVAGITAIAILILGIVIFFRMMQEMKRLYNKLETVSTGDFTVDFTNNREDEFSKISKTVGETFVKLRALIRDMKNMNMQVNESTRYVNEVANIFASSSEEISEALQEVARDVVNQANDADNCLTQMNQLSEEVHEVYHGASKIESISSNTNKVVEESIQVVDQLASNMKDSSVMTKVVIENVESLSTQSKSIEKIVDVINEIAEETNLLSLNASIEAARAGEAGRGFVVVADQVRKLADQSVEQVVEISKIVSSIQAKTSETVRAVKETEKYVEIQESSLQRTIATFAHIQNQFNMLLGELSMITKGIERIEKAKNETLDSVRNIFSYTQETSATTEEISATALSQMDSVVQLRERIQHLEQQAIVLTETVDRLKVEE